MSYAGDRVIYDADSHLMEMPDFLSAHADAAIRDRLPTFRSMATGQFDPGDLAADGRHDPATVRTLVKLGDQITRGPKWHAALGAADGGERVLALDLLGFRRQVVFSSFCARLVFGGASELAYGTAAAHNRAMAAYCSADPRLIGVGMVPLDDPQQALTEIDRVIELGLGAVWISADPPGGRSPGHPAHDTIWATLCERRLPFILHVGSAPLQIPAPWMNDGIAGRVSARGGAEVIGSKDLTVIHHPFQRFVSALVLDGVLERFPGLRGAVIEVGAGWVPDMIRRLDHAASIWAKSEPHLAQFRRKPSAQIRDQMRFTPYPFEDVGAIVRESAAELFMFSSDYPHAEGGRDPIGRFEDTTSSLSPAAREGFFARNFLDLFPAEA